MNRPKLTNSYNIPFFTGLTDVPENILLNDICYKDDFSHHFFNNVIVLYFFKL